ncbi:hypothetical protein E4U13_002859 [Claviceps humidiphila]|uniref:DNA mismatch repair proteins mutS family domain-containing protein n=1 Tax=Claviceps humidiphila TaxID=1294629 RepID=A0A9P7Q6D1_9HYPO|nr:hypothetical protein E4U13_002859 [Claviceps humidiphila]
MFRLHPSHRLPLSYCRNVSFGACRTAPRPLAVSGNPCRLVASSAATPRTRKSGKTKTILKLSDLPQGPVPGKAQPALEIDRDDKKPHTVVEQARQNMRKFENCVLLTRVGGFYELYHEHAEEYGPLLNLKVAVKKMLAGDVSMAGFPCFQLDRYLKILVQDMQRHVAVCEEFPKSLEHSAKSGELMFDRRVARIITPGTLIDENFIDPYANNYVLAIHVGETKDGAEEPSALVQDSKGTLQNPDASLPIGLAWLDLSTGHFFTQATDLSSLPSTLSRIGPREVVLSADIESQQDHGIFSVLTEDRHLVTFALPGELTNMMDWTPFLEAPLPRITQQTFTSEEVSAGNLVLNYIKDKLQGTRMHLLPPRRHETMQAMSIDKNSLRALEITKTLRDGLFRGSLLHAIRRTVTKSGARLLQAWLSSPSISLDDIHARQNLVGLFIAMEHLRDSIIVLLRRCHDSQRLVQKFSIGRGGADELLDLAHTIRATKDIVDMLNDETDVDPSQHGSQNDCLKALSLRIDLTGPLELAQRIKNSIDEEGVVHQHEVQKSEANQLIALAQDVIQKEGSEDDALAIVPKSKKKRASPAKEDEAEESESWIMKPDASAGLRSLHSQLRCRLNEKVELRDSLRKKLNAQSLNLRWSPGLGHYAHVRGTKDLKNLVDVKTMSASKSTKSIFVPEWTALGGRLDRVRTDIRNAEQALFQSLREQVVLNLVKLRRNAAVLDELDITTSFAKLAIEQNLVRPIVNNSKKHTIIGGRHPTVEGGLSEKGRSFVRNDCLVGSPAKGLVWLITGPNMAGKSTFLRQNALITILAQIGCYVPASCAEIGVVDAIFSRVGSADDLFRDQSTFMVEMLETAQILRQATPRSFVIMDEIGRGTTPEDGTAVSYACLHHLVTVNQCRTLFATHFHKVADLAAADGLSKDDGQRGDVQYYCTDLEEDKEGGFAYVHKLRRGMNRQSHALKVAGLAGVPERAIAIARRVLEQSRV